MPSASSIRTRPDASAIGATPLGTRASNSSADTRQTVRDVLTGDAAGVEGTHGQLGAGLADRLGGDDADRLADVDQLAGGQRPAVAGRAGAERRLAGQHRAHPHLGHARGDQLVDQHVTEVGAGRGERLAVGLDVLGEHPGVDRGLDVDVLDQRAVGGRGGDRQRDAAVGAAVLLADDHVLR